MSLRSAVRRPKAGGMSVFAFACCLDCPGYHLIRFECYRWVKSSHSSVWRSREWNRAK